MPARRSILFTAALAGAIVATPVVAQRFSDGYTFLQAIRESNGAKVTELLNQPGSRIVDTRDEAGEGALHIIAKRSDETYLRFILSRNANPNLQDRRGNTPMMVAATAGFIAGVQILKRYNADPNIANASGETPLIRAVQLRNYELAQALLAIGADPDQTDSLAGLSARDYAKQDTRSPALAKLLTDAPRAQRSRVVGPTL